MLGLATYLFVIILDPDGMNTMVGAPKWWFKARIASLKKFKEITTSKCSLDSIRLFIGLLFQKLSVRVAEDSKDACIICSILIPGRACPESEPDDE